MKNILNILVFLSLFAVSAQTNMQQSSYNREIKAEIFLEQNGDYVTVKGVVSNLTEVSASIRYELAVFKKDSLNNTIKNKQEGRGVINSKTKAILSTTTVNTNNPAKITIMLLIYNLDDKLVGKELKTLKENTLQLEKEKSKSQDGVEFRGIVIKKVTTKPARDFYKYFFSQYRRYKINGSRVVTIQEEFGQGRSSQINVLVGRDIVFQFFVSPKKKYLFQMGDLAIDKVYKQFLFIEQQESNQNQ